MELHEIKTLINIASSVIVTFTTEKNLDRIKQIRDNVADMSEDTVDYVQEMLKDAGETAKIVEQIILDVMITAGLQTPKVRSRSIDKEVLKALRREIQNEFEKRRKDDGKVSAD